MAEKIDDMKKGTRPIIELDSPQIIRARNKQAQGIAVPAELHVRASLAGKLGGGVIDTAEMQRKWNEEYNADTKNITSDEWIVIEAMRKALIGGKSVEQISAQDKKDIEVKVDRLKAQFNKTAANDGVSQDVISIIPPSSLPQLPKEINRPSWRL